jgi:hypothetical protein
VLSSAGKLTCATRCQLIQETEFTSTNKYLHRSLSFRAGNEWDKYIRKAPARYHKHKNRTRNSTICSESSKRPIRSSSSDSSRRLEMASAKILEISFELVRRVHRLRTNTRSRSRTTTHRRLFSYVSGRRRGCLPNEAGNVRLSQRSPISSSRLVSLQLALGEGLPLRQRSETSGDGIQGYSRKLNLRTCWVCQKSSRLSIYPRERHEDIQWTLYVPRSTWGVLSHKDQVSIKKTKTRPFLSDMQSPGISTDKPGGRIYLNR